MIPSGSLIGVLERYRLPDRVGTIRQPAPTSCRSRSPPRRKAKLTIEKSIPSFLDTGEARDNVPLLPAPMMAHPSKTKVIASRAVARRRSPSRYGAWFPDTCWYVEEQGNTSSPLAATSVSQST